MKDNCGTLGPLFFSFIEIYVTDMWSLQVALAVKNLPAGDARDVGSIHGSGRSPEGGHGNLLQYSCLENPHGQRNLVGYSPWGRKELGRTERLNSTDM